MSHEKRSILVVDDDPDIRSNLADILSDLGHEVHTAPDGLKALELVRHRGFDLALLDLRMPGMDGLELLRHIKQISGSTVAVVITAFATPETVTEAASRGVWKVLSKPVNLMHVLTIVREAIDYPTVIVVDDDHALCDSLSTILQDRGFRVSTARSAEEAERILDQQSFHVALVDLRLPSRDGVELMRWIRTRRPGTKVVMVTGHKNDLHERLENAKASGADAICYKPFDVARLIDLIEGLTETVRPRSELGSA